LNVFDFALDERLGQPHLLNMFSSELVLTLPGGLP